MAIFNCYVSSPGGKTLVTPTSLTRQFLSCPAWSSHRPSTFLHRNPMGILGIRLLWTSLNYGCFMMFHVPKYATILWSSCSVSETKACIAWFRDDNWPSESTPSCFKDYVEECIRKIRDETIFGGKTITSSLTRADWGPWGPSPNRRLW